eukprot:TRINITY_DN1478_c0_g1_i1.p1 TRINITY_DN1478_c0_g1~~TRINITY_DN1478_c0_g1_i1.p1  ORF type:complete len:273 (+),score=90.23 TRINITY_DN1478_c0_g1_i1:118-936(+)
MFFHSHVNLRKKTKNPEQNDYHDAFEFFQIYMERVKRAPKGHKHRDEEIATFLGQIQLASTHLKVKHKITGQEAAEIDLAFEPLTAIRKKYLQKKPEPTPKKRKEPIKIRVPKASPLSMEELKKNLEDVQTEIANCPKKIRKKCKAIFRESEAVSERHAKAKLEKKKKKEEEDEEKKKNKKKEVCRELSAQKKKDLKNARRRELAAEKRLKKKAEEEMKKKEEVKKASLKKDEESSDDETTSTSTGVSSDVDDISTDPQISSDDDESSEESE